MALAIAGTPTKSYVASASSLTFAHTATGDGLFVGCGGYADPARAINSVTFNGDAMTEVWDINDGYWGNFSNAGYLMCAPDTGAAYNVVITGSGSFDMLFGVAVGVSGLASPVASARRTAYTDGDTNTLTVANSQSGDLVIDVMITYSSSVTAGAGQSSQGEYDNPEGAGHSFGVSTEAASGANTVMSWTAASQPRCMGAVALIAAAGGSNHALTLSGLSVASSVGAPALAQVHALTPSGLSMATSVPAAVLTQGHVLALTGLAAASQVGAPALAQVHAFTPAGLVAASEVPEAALTQGHALTPQGLLVAPDLPAAVLSQAHVLALAGLLAASEAGLLTVTEGDYALSLAGLLAACEVGAPALTQDHALALAGLLAAAQVGSPSLAQIHALVLEGLVSASEVGQTTVTVEELILALLGLVAQAEVGAPALSQDHALVLLGLLSASEVALLSVFGFFEELFATSYLTVADSGVAYLSLTAAAESEMTRTLAVEAEV